MSANSNSLLNTTGIQVKKDACVVIVRTEWNDAIVGALETGCKKILDAHQVAYKVVTVPGAFEIPFGIKRYWEQHKYKDDKPHAFIALGCVLRGDTPHFDYVAGEAAKIGTVSLETGVPCIFGVLTTDTIEQAIERSGTKAGNKGFEAAMVAIEMATLVEKI